MNTLEGQMESLHNDVHSNFVEESNQEDEHEHEHEHAIGIKREINEASVKAQDAMNLAKQWELEIAQDLETRTPITCTSTTSSNSCDSSITNESSSSSDNISTCDSRTLEGGNQTVDYLYLHQILVYEKYTNKRFKL